MAKGKVLRLVLTVVFPQITVQDLWQLSRHAVRKRQMGCCDHLIESYREDMGSIYTNLGTPDTLALGS